MTTEKSESLLFEDLTVASNNALGVGDTSGMNLKPKKVSLFDLVKQAKDWESEITRAPNRLPLAISTVWMLVPTPTNFMLDSSVI